MKSVFITGAGGFIGRRLASCLLEQNKAVTVLVLPSEAEEFTPTENLTVVIGDLSNPSGIKERVEGAHFDVMYHLAWVGVSSAYKADSSIQLRNISLAFSAMELAEALNCDRVICTGSVSEYAYTKGAIDGSQPPAPADMYAATKAAVHLYCELIARQRAMGFNWVLIPSIYGPGRMDNNLITYSIQTLLAGRRPSYTKLEQLWDYIYIDDLIEALYLVGEKGQRFKTYVAGSGKSRHMYEYVKILCDMINPHAELGIGDLPYKSVTADNAVCEISELTNDTGFVPKTDFEKGIRVTIDFFKTMSNGLEH